MDTARGREFLKWAAPRLGLRVEGYRRVGGQVFKRLQRRLRTLGLPDLDAYQRFLNEHPEEWPVLEGMSRITISRFYRDASVFDRLRSVHLPALASRGGQVTVFSLGCASGEEAHTVALLWMVDIAPRFPSSSLNLVAVDAEAHMIERARSGCHPCGALRELPTPLREAGFDVNGSTCCVRESVRRMVDFRVMDVRSALPEGTVDLTLCRNSVFTYVDRAAQPAFLERLHRQCSPGALLVIGLHESLPERQAWFTPVERAIYKAV